VIIVLRVVMVFVSERLFMFRDGVATARVSDVGLKGSV
jgi:hypothetical protein